MSEVKRYTTNAAYVELPYGSEVVTAAAYDTLRNEWRVATGAVIMQRKELAELRDELAQRDVRIAELEATKLHGEMVMLRTERDRPAAELKYTIAAYVTGNKPSAAAENCAMLAQSQEVKP